MSAVAPPAPLVLILDPSEDICRLLDLALTSEGYRVESTLDGAAFLEHLRACRPDLVIYEPGNGPHWQDAVRAMLALLDGGRLARGVSVLVCTAAYTSTEALPVEVLCRPATTVLAKPFNLDVLFALAGALCPRPVSLG